VATPAPPLLSAPIQVAARTAGDVRTFRSRPDLTPAAVEVTKGSAVDASLDLFLAPQAGPLQNGPMIVDSRGHLVWFDPIPHGELATDFRAQTFDGRPVLTWWQGLQGAGVGAGEDVIESSSYQQLAVVHAGNGLDADLHEFRLTRDGTALITAYYPVYWDATSIHGSRQTIVLDSVVQEIDVRTGLVVFQWDSLDHVPLTDSYESLPTQAGHPYDYFHVNSVQQTADGDLIISARNTWAAYQVARSDGHVIWTLGGKHSTFTMGAGASYAFQHDVRVHTGPVTTVTMFDDGGGPPSVHAQSRGLTLRLDLESRRAVLVSEVEHSPALQASFEGNVQVLGGGDELLGWGQQPYFSEVDSQGQVVFEGRFVDDNTDYRAYRFAWQGQPRTPPAVAASDAGGSTTVYASWNGATDVASWRVLGGGDAMGLRPVGDSPKRGFETRIAVPAQAYVEVQALGADGRVLATSSVVQPS
jgi:hypothetical protein